MTDAEFLRFLRYGSSKIAVIVEIEFAYESGGALATGTIRLSDREDAVAGSIPYRTVIARSPELERAIDLQKLGGRGARTLGEISINNADDSFSYLLDAIVDGRDAAIYVGGQGWARADYRLFAKGAVASVSAPNDGELVIKLRDKNYLLDDTIIGDTIAIGPNIGKPKPILLGSVRNFDVTPYLFDAAALKYYINNFPLNSSIDFLSDCRDAGLSLKTLGHFPVVSAATMSADAGTDTLTRTTNHNLAVNDVVVFRAPGGLPAPLAQNTQYWVIAAGLTATDFRLALTKGGSAIDLTTTTFSGSGSLDRFRYYVDTANATLELSGSPSGRVTIDLDAESLTAGYLLSMPHGMFKYVLQNYSQLTAADYDATAMDALYSAELTGGTFFGIAILDRANIVDILDAVALGTLSWYGWNASGVLTVGKLDLQNLDAATATDAIGKGDIVGEMSAENQALPWGKITLDSRRNVVTQTDGLAVAVPASLRSQWAQNFQARVSTTDPGTTGYLANWWDYHKSAIDSKPIETRLDASAVGAQPIVDEMTALFRPWTRVHRCQVGFDKYALNPGACVIVTHPRYGLKAGKKCRVISVRPRVSERVVDLVLVRQALPDYTTAAH